jgi:hypothetical protein
MYADRKIRRQMSDDGAVRDQIVALTNTIQVASAVDAAAKHSAASSSVISRTHVGAHL